MTVILYRNDDMSCIAAAWICEMQEPDAELHPVATIDSTYVLTRATKTIVIGDCYSPGEMTKLAAKTKLSYWPLCREEAHCGIVHVKAVWDFYHPDARPPWVVEYLEDITAEQFELPQSYAVAQFLWAACSAPSDLSDAQLAGFEAVATAGQGCIQHENFVARQHHTLYYVIEIDGLQVAIVNTIPTCMGQALDNILATSGYDAAIAWHWSDNELVPCVVKAVDGEHREKLVKYFDGDLSTGLYVLKSSETLKMLMRGT